MYGSLIYRHMTQSETITHLPYKKTNYITSLFMNRFKLFLLRLKRGILREILYKFDNELTNIFRVIRVFDLFRYNIAPRIIDEKLVKLSK